MKFQKNVEPWYRKHDGWWYVTLSIDGKRDQIKLLKAPSDPDDETKAAIWERMWEVRAANGDVTVDTSQDGPTFNEIAALFLVWAKENCEAETADWYRRFISSFDKFYRGRVSQLTKGHVTRWLNEHDWSVSTQRQAITCIKRVVNHAFEENYLAEYPPKLRKLKRPKMRRRDVVLTKEQRELILENTDAAFRLFLTALAETGCRPGEVMKVTAANVDLELGVWIFEKHKTSDKTQESRIVYLTPTMVEITKELMAKHSEGQLFRNSRGKAWNRNAVRCRMKRLRTKLNLPKGTVAYTYRHSFVTDGLENGVPLADLAELCGHKDTRMIMEHYSKLRTRVEHLRNAAKKATD